MSDKLDATFEQAIVDALDDARLEEVVGKAVKDAVRETVSDMFRWNKPLRNALGQKINDAMVPAIERYDFGEYNLKLDMLLAELIGQTEIETNKRILANFKGMMKKPIADVVTLEVLFDEYKKCVAREIDCDGREVEFDERPYYRYVDVAVDVDIDETRGFMTSHQIATVKFSIGEDEDEEQRDKLNRVVELYRWDTFPSDGRWIIRKKPVHGFESLRSMTSFDVYMASLEMNGSYVADLEDLRYPSDSVEPDKEPEPTYE